ncbi:MAG: caspase family protein [Candidatus Sumerlaeota bacterium]|nr:caspase family protein [Candidatus Sumerlaeota bacterium]
MSVLAIGVSAYDNFQHLKGPSRDLEMIESIFSSSGSLGLVDPKRIRTKHNPTSDDIRKLIKEHADSKSASGDITIFYFSGHGCAYASGEFALCGKDARRIGINDSIDPMSVIKFADIIEAFRAMDIHPVFIIDACFSGLAALDRSLSPDKIPDSIARDLRDKLGGSYALLCACSSDQTAKDDMNGGLFTQTIFEICSNGLAKSTHKNQRFINLSDIDALINKKASKIGMSPLPRYYSGQLLSEVPLCKNIRFP